MGRILLLTFLTFLHAGLMAQSGPGGLRVNEKAPGFTAPDQSGRSVSLRQLLLKGPVVLIFYRGEWCPYCNRELRHLEDSLTLIFSKGASLVAVTPELPENINKTIEKTKASYPILFDKGMKIMKAYDVAFAVDDKTLKRYRRFGLDLSVNNGANGNNLPVPAVFVINTGGIIVYRYFNPDYRYRASVAEILAHL